jgi:3-methylfumaryl-CoA hydratase
MTDTGEMRFETWIGQTSEATDVVTARLVASFRAIFDPYLADVPDGAAPLGIHWCLSPPIVGMAELGEDGHPAKNRHMPPIPLPRRMWAGGTTKVLKTLRVGDKVTRITTIADVTSKHGRTGELWFVAVDHDYRVDGESVIRERNNIVYREAASAGSGASDRTAPNESEARANSGRTWTVEITPTFLFRYSAITFNGHRIHYDYPYATGVEGYGGLVIHGPVQATLLLNIAAAESGTVPKRIRYRAVAPAICGDPLVACTGTGDDTGKCWAMGPDGRVTMQASADD